jgi:LPXTG-site transpeptidase (sortase) family protein
VAGVTAVKCAACLTLTAAVVLSGAADVQAQVGEPIGWLIIPDIDLWRPLYAIPVINRQYDMDAIGANGAGWLEQTNWLMDDWGTIGLAGHSDGAFIRLGDLQTGDVIYLTTRDTEEVYAVTAIYHDIPASNWQWIAPAPEGEHLVLVTCEGQNRLIVQALRIE